MYFTYRFYRPVRKKVGSREDPESASFSVAAFNKKEFLLVVPVKQFLIRENASVSVCTCNAKEALP